MLVKITLRHFGRTYIRTSELTTVLVRYRSCKSFFKFFFKLRLLTKFCESNGSLRGPVRTQFQSTLNAAIRHHSLQTPPCVIRIV